MNLLNVTKKIKIAEKREECQKSINEGHQE
jgi:hypothetical protein